MSTAPYAPVAHQDPVKLIRSLIRGVPDWPQPGVLFRDITPLIQDAVAFRALIDLFVLRHMRQRLDLVVGIDARGFIFGSALAYALNVGFVPVRKKGKLPFKTMGQSYTLEYGSSDVEIHVDAVQPGQRAIRLLQQLGGNVIEAAAIVDLPDLGGSREIAKTGTPFFSVCQFTD
jgi:adenine phosphoribosyltransferase